MKEKNDGMFNIGMIEGAEIRLSQIPKKKTLEKVRERIDELRLSGMEEWDNVKGNKEK